MRGQNRDARLRRMTRASRNPLRKVVLDRSLFQIKTSAKSRISRSAAGPSPNTPKNTPKSKCGLTVKFHFPPHEIGASELFSLPRCAILVPPTPLFATDAPLNALRPLLPLRNGDRTEQIVL